MFEMTKPAWLQIEELVKDVPGWTPIDELFAIYALGLTTAHLKGCFIEIGSWCGRSSVVLGKAARQIGNTKVHCIDLFPERDDWKENPDGSRSMQVTIGDSTFQGYMDQTVWKEPFERDIAPLYETRQGILEVFEQTVASCDLKDIVVPFRGVSKGFAATIPSDFQCKLAFVDGDHGYEPVADDITFVGKHLVPGGWICFDDAFSYYDGVNRAIRDHVIANPAFGPCQQLTRKLFVAQKKA